MRRGEDQGGEDIPPMRNPREPQRGWRGTSATQVRHGRGTSSRLRTTPHGALRWMTRTRHKLMRMLVETAAQGAPEGVVGAVVTRGVPDPPPFPRAMEQGASKSCNAKFRNHLQQVVAIRLISDHLFGIPSSRSARRSRVGVGPCRDSEWCGCSRQRSSVLQRET